MPAGVVGWINRIYTRVDSEARGEDTVRPHRNLCIYLILILVTMTPLGCSDGNGGLFKYKAYKFPAKSMLPTLIPGDRILVDLQHYRDHKPQRGDIIVFKCPKHPLMDSSSRQDSKDWIKRVIAIERDVVKVEDKKFYLNGQLIEEPYVQHTTDIIKMVDNLGPIVVPEGTLFVMGDNRDKSFDSRHFGVVPVDNVKGKVLYIYWSKDFGRIGTKIE